jgi:4a-hydroxytetrahydrobiopterin dehydratase
MLGTIQTEVLAPSLIEATEAASLAVSAAAADGQGHLTVDIRADRAVLRLQSAEAGWVTGRDIRLAHRVSGALGARGLHTTPGDGSVQMLEIAIDALDIPLVRPFWKAITGYADEPGSELQAALIDPSGRGPAIWFQQMDAPRPQRNRIHIDVDVRHEAASARIDAAIAAGGTLLSDRAAPAFWVLADPEGNEACICTWQGRD